MQNTHGSRISRLILVDIFSLICTFDALCLIVFAQEQLARKVQVHIRHADHQVRGGWRRCRGKDMLANLVHNQQISQRVCANGKSQNLQARSLPIPFTFVAPSDFVGDLAPVGARFIARLELPVSCVVSIVSNVSCVHWWYSMLNCFKQLVYFQATCLWNLFFCGNVGV